MGTHGLLGHIIRGKKKGTYNNKDSYPVGLGIFLVDFIKSLSNAQIDKMAKRVDDLIW